MSAHRLLGATLALLLVAGCGARVDQTLPFADPAEDEAHAAALAALVPEDVELPAQPDDPAEPDDLPTDTAAPASPPHATEDGSATADTPGDEPADAPASDQHILLQLDTRPKCVESGNVVAVTISTEPSAELTMVVAYADGQPHGQLGFANADGQGGYLWRWVVGPEIPRGEATVLVQSWSQDGDRGGHATDTFVVAEQGGC